MDMGSKLFNTDGIKKFAAWYIDTSEKVANGMLDYQASAHRMGQVDRARTDFRGAA